MRRIDWRLWRSVAGLCLPTLAVVALGVFFYLDKVPEIEKGERGRVREAYRYAAAAIRLNPSAYRTMTLPEAWKSCGQMKPGKWGFLAVPAEGFTWVWYEREDRQISYTRVDCVPETDFRTWFAAGGSFFLLVLIWVTVIGIRFFVGYMKARDDFLSATAHDLTTPLVGLRMMIGRNDEEAAHLNERMLLIVNNIKDFLKLGGKRGKPAFRDVDIVALGKEAYGLFAADYDDAPGGPVTFDAPADMPPPVLVRADETMTLQILWNLFGNDLKYAAPYGRVSVRFSRADGFVRVEFVDEGQGMTRRQMRHAFDRYYRAKTVLESGKGGFGIGLCTSRELARAMGGDLTVRPNPGGGCIFSLSLRQSSPAAGPRQGAHAAFHARDEAEMCYNIRHL